MQYVLTRYVKIHAAYYEKIKTKQFLCLVSLSYKDTLYIYIYLFLNSF